MRKFGGVAAVAAGVVALAGCGGGDAGAGTTSSSASSSTTSMSKLQAAVETCSTFPDSVLSSDGISATLDTKGNDDFNGEDIEEVNCVLSSLAAPDHVRTHIGSTRALDGQQTDQWDDYEARWTYHPDSGLQITIIDRS